MAPGGVRPLDPQPEQTAAEAEAGCRRGAAADGGSLREPGTEVPARWTAARPLAGAARRAATPARPARARRAGARDDSAHRPAGAGVRLGVPERGSARDRGRAGARRRTVPLTATLDASTIWP